MQTPVQILSKMFPSDQMVLRYLTFPTSAPLNLTSDFCHFLNGSSAPDLLGVVDLQAAKVYFHFYISSLKNRCLEGLLACRSRPLANSSCN